MKCGWSKVWDLKVITYLIGRTNKAIMFTALSQADIRLGLLSSERKRGLKSGTILWLVLGISLEDEQ